MEKSIILNVHHPPTLKLKVIDNINPLDLREGDTVLLKCLIQAHPWVFKTLWYKNGEEMASSNHIIIDEQQLILRDISKNVSGQYVCSASNVQGEGFSKYKTIFTYTII